jgi:hypothetical protein
LGHPPPLRKKENGHTANGLWFLEKKGYNPRSFPLQEKSHACTD